MGYLYDYKLTARDSLRIMCDAPFEGNIARCGEPATTGQNDGVAPFWYRCDAHAQKWRNGHLPFPQIALPRPPRELPPETLNALASETRKYIFELERQLKYAGETLDRIEARLGKAILVR